MTIRDALWHIQTSIKRKYEDTEITRIAELILENITGIAHGKLNFYKDNVLHEVQHAKLNAYIRRLKQDEPVQYVLQEAWFYHLKFYVDKNVLIPRPETEELVHWVLKEVRSRKPENPAQNTELRILDIGTGSGCIAIALKKNVPFAEVWACDSSEGALQVARSNAYTHATEINFIQMDFLDAAQRNSLPTFDLLVSNPPYIPLSDKKFIQPHVLNYEPHVALFVPENDPLIFYKTIADFAKQKLAQGGRLFVETHENLGQLVAELFRSSGFRSVEIKKDMQGKERMVRAGEAG